MHEKVNLLIARLCLLPRCKNLDKKIKNAQEYINSTNSLMLKFAPVPIYQKVR